MGIVMPRRITPNFPPDRYNKRCHPYIVTAHMAEPVVTYDGDIHLDGILAYVRQATARNQGEDIGPDGVDVDHMAWPKDVLIPLAIASMPYDGNCDDRLRDENGDVWFWCARRAIAEWEIETMVELRKMPDMGAAAAWSESPSWQTGGGGTKAVNKRLPARFAETISWFCLGDSKSCERLLRAITHIGKLRNHGYGRVMRWDTQRIDGRPWELMGKDGPIRDIPAGSGARKGSVIRRAIRPPYHHRSRSIYVERASSSR